MCIRDSHEGAWQRLIDGSGDGRDSIGMQLIDALIEQRSLLLELKITEINQVARQLLNIDCHEGAWQRLIDGTGDGRDSVGMQLIDALIEQRPLLELEVRLPAPLGGELHLWLMARLPQQRRA